MTIRQITDLYLNKKPSLPELDRAPSLDALASSWREHFRAIRAL
jgi:hypothetical protein